MRVDGSGIMSEEIAKKELLTDNSSAIFLDRDGTIIEDVGYINNPDDIRFLPKAIEGLRMFSLAGFSLIVISNQSGLARGLITEEQFQAVHNRFVDLLRKSGIELTDCLYCPYYKDAVVKKYRSDSPERKPAPGMIIRAARGHNISLEKSFMIGDKDDDIRAGQAAGVKTIKIVPKSSKAGKGKSLVNPDFFADNLEEAAKIVLSAIRVSEEIKTDIKH